MATGGMTTQTGGASSAEPSPQPRRRDSTVALLGMALTVAWIAAGAALSLGVMKAQADTAQASLSSAQEHLATGDLEAAQASLAEADRDVFAMSAVANGPQLRLLSVLPPSRALVDDVDHMVAAIAHITDASSTVVATYAQARGDTAGAAPVFASGRVDLESLSALQPNVAEIKTELESARAELEQVRPGPEGSETLAQARADALAQVEPLQSTVQQLGVMLPLLPDALGGTGPRRYLVTMLNEGETRASGGAPLSVAVVRFQDGALDIPFKGAVAQVPWPGQGQQYGVLHWQGAPRSPWNRPEGQRVDRFANANFAADFRSAGYDLAAAWAAGGYGQVDGVIALDVTALASILRRTGPIAESPYGELTADNIGQKLLIDSYRDFADDQTARQTANQIIVSAVFQRLTTPASAFQVASALAEETPGRHVQVWFRDAALAASAHALRVDGAIADDSRDQAGLFSQNGNSSKADIFQVRQYGIDATVAADGSAAVVQTLRVRQAIPESLSVDGMTGYLAGWLNGSWFVLSPPEAVNPRLAIPDDWLRGRWPAEGVWVDDGYGHLLQRVEGAVPPGQQVDLTLTYTLPAGTFTEPDGSLVYRLDIEPQPIWGPVAARVTVVGPSGQQVVQEQLVDGRVAVALPIR